ncbi:MAG: cyclodeaminase/cyclohydrolase family protein [Acidobacteria bacterium]|nr:cyclodeaminase/cyclohydrolase family protein [Acidobacteriota bacterium]
MANDESPTSHQPLVTMAVMDLLDALAASEPAPGGGSAAALAGAVGVSLLIMVAGLQKTKSGTPEEAADLTEASARLRPLREALTALVDQDSDAYAAVVAARRLPRDPARRSRNQNAALGPKDAVTLGDTNAPLSEKNKVRRVSVTEAAAQARREAIHAATVQATDVPMETMRACQQALRGAVVVAANGQRNAASDTGVAVELLLAAVRGAGLNVDANVEGLSDTALVERVRDERRELEEEAEADARRARDLLQHRAG